MAIKTHLADSEVPLKEGSKLLAICGALVPDAAFVFMWDETGIKNSDFTVMLGRLGMCGHCAKRQATQRYIYGIRSGEEQKQTEAQ
jgi:hypothetical protein